MNTTSRLNRTVIAFTFLAFGLGSTVAPCRVQGGGITVPNCSCSDLQRGDCAGCRAFQQQIESGVAPPVMPPIESPGDVTPQPPETPQFDETPPEIQQALSPAQPGINQFAGAFGATNAGAGIPGMLGDFCGLSPPIGDDTGQPFAPGPGAIAPVAGGNCRHKFAEFTSPCPTDRVFFTYHHYENGITDFFGRVNNVDLVTLGLEKTLFQNLASIEVRVPFLSGLESYVYSQDTFGAAFGNVSTTLKVLLAGNRRSAVSTGVTFIWPTGDDADYFGHVVENEAIHAAPFIAWMRQSPRGRMFQQAVAQTDFDLNGDTIRDVTGDTDNFNAQSLLYVDYSIGYWLFQNRRACLRGMAAMIECHYTSTLQDVDRTPIGGGRFFLDARRDILNMTAGFHTQLGRRTTLRFAGGAPMLDDRAFDGEFTLQLARYF